MTTIQSRRGTLFQWNAANPVLASGEVGFETDTGKHKIGDGTRVWSALPYFLNENSLTAMIAAAGTSALIYDSGTGSYPARPSGAASVLWIGPTQPPAMTANDLWDDTATVSGYKWTRDAFTVTLGGTVTVTLGATPVTDSETVWIKPAAGNAYVASEKSVGYSMTGNQLVFTGLSANDRVMVKYQFSADQAGGAATVDQVALVVSDTFTRADSAATLGNAETGQPWSVLSGTGGLSTWGITSNKAYVAVVKSDDYVVVDSLKANATIEVKIAAVASGGSMGLYVRATDAANGFTSNLSGLFRRQAGSNIGIITYSAAFVAGDTMRIVTAGTLITVYRDAGSIGTFVQVGQATDSFQATATKHGLRSSSNTGGANQFDNFKVYA